MDMDEMNAAFSNYLENDENRIPLDNEDVMNELFADAEEPQADEAQEERTAKIVDIVHDGDIVQVKKPKRVLLKLDLEKLFSDRGLSAIPQHIKPLTFRGKGRELEDITKICKAYEHWAHRLYPKMTFKDVLEKIEHLGMKNRKKCFNKRMELYEEARRLCVITGEAESDGEAQPQSSDLFGDGEAQPQTSDLFGDSTFADPVVDQPTFTAPQLSEEQLEKIRQNRIRALEKKKQRTSAVHLSQQHPVSPLAQNNKDNLPDISVEQSPESDSQSSSKRFKASDAFD